MILFFLPILFFAGRTILAVRQDLQICEIEEIEDLRMCFPPPMGGPWTRRGSGCEVSAMVLDLDLELDENYAHRCRQVETSNDQWCELAHDRA
jgi:hypothetical protein